MTFKKWQLFFANNFIKSQNVLQPHCLSLSLSLLPRRQVLESFEIPFVYLKLIKLSSKTFWSSSSWSENIYEMPPRANINKATWGPHSLLFTPEAHKFWHLWRLFWPDCLSACLSIYAMLFHRGQCYGHLDTFSRASRRWDEQIWFKFEICFSLSALQHYKLYQKF